jgi:uncharacterized caspase-like protein
MLAPLSARSQQRGVTVKGTGPAEDTLIAGDYWALIIGINEYPNLGPDMQLQAARADAQAVATVLQQRYGFAQQRMIQLYDKKATRDEIMLALEKLAEVTDEKDSVLIYYAGHGEYSKDKNRGYWIPSDAVKGRTPSYVSNADIRDYLTNIKARHIYTISDSCFSESLMGKTRSLGSGSERAFKELYSSKSRLVLTSGGLYPVPDKAKGNHSVFAYHLLRMLEKNDNQYITPQMIIAQIQTLVANESQQTPKSAPVAFAGDEGGQFLFRLALYKAPEPPKPAAPGMSPEEEKKQMELMLKMMQEKARLEEDAKKLREAEQKLREREAQAEKDRIAKEQERLVREQEQQRRMEEERRRLEREKSELEADKSRQKKKADPVFVPPTF